MKIEKENETDYKIYLFSIKIDELNLMDDIKEFISKIQKILKLNGFYKVIVCLKEIGCFIKMIRLEDSFYKNTLDLKIERSYEDIYFKTTDYFLVKDLSLVKYLDGVYYGLVDDSFDEILEKVEFGDFVFGYDYLDIINRSYVI